MQVLNRHHFKDGLPANAIYVGRGTALGNPFRIDDDRLDRSGVIVAYRVWINERILARDPVVLTALAGLRESNDLVCSCAPAPCHADVIRTVWQQWQTAGGIGPGPLPRFHLDGTLPADGEILVFGSNAAARHGKGAAAAARDHFGASPQVSEGYSGRAPHHSYAIPTKSWPLAPLSLEQIRSNIDRFVAHAHANPNERYFITRVGCGLAGFDDAAIAPLFAGAPKGRCSFAQQWAPYLTSRTRTPTLRYAGVGSRKTPSGFLARMTRAAQRLEERGYTLLSGGAAGADTAFEAGAESKEIYLPPYRSGKAPELWEEALGIAKAVHPRFDRLTDQGQQLMARNSYQVLGLDLRRPVDFVLCWTPDGAESEAERTKDTGGTGQAIALASRWQIPIFNMSRTDALTRLAHFLDASN